MCGIIVRCHVGENFGLISNSGTITNSGFICGEIIGNLPQGNPLSPSCDSDGDADNSGSVDIFDALLVAEYDVGLKSESEVPGFYRCDVDNNGSVDIFDALTIAELSITLD